MKIRPTPPPRTPALVRSRIARGAIGAGAIAAGLVVACGGKQSGDNQTGAIAPQDPPQVSPQPNECGPNGKGHCIPPQLPPQDPPQDPPPPQVAPQPPQPPQPFDGGFFDAGSSDADDAG